MMKNRFFIIFIIFIFSCKTYEKVPHPSQLGVNVYGSYMSVIQNQNIKTEGELIAFKNDSLIILTSNTKQCITIPISTILNFKLIYSTSRNYTPTIIPSLILPGIHGFYSIYSIPIHLITTIALSVNSNKAYTYSDKDTYIYNLKMFSRFPQGLPPKVDLSLIK